MTIQTPIAAASALQRFSAGEISRSELGRLMGAPVSFGDVLMMLHKEKLPLPRYGRPFNPDGIALIQQLAQRNNNG